MFPVHTITLDHPAYPPLLQHIPQPPKQLYCRGDVSLLRAPQLFAVVGSRKMSTYGNTATRDAVAGLVARGVVTVSGLAFGVDKTAHEETLQRGGKTIAVLGSPVENSEIQPRSNTPVAQRILEAGGLLVSEYASGVQIYSSYFPARNRIIAGISSAVLVVEASQKSGALITARFAVECGRDVYAVPGSIFAPLSIGTNSLIERGAIPWLSCASFGTDIEYERYADHATPEQHRVLDACADAPRTVDELCEITSLPAAEVMHHVTMLELNGLLRNLGDQTYVQ